jgi:hypothetical protein
MIEEWHWLADVILNGAPPLKRGDRLRRATVDEVVQASEERQILRFTAPAGTIPFDLLALEGPDEVEDL